MTINMFFKKKKKKKKKKIEIVGNIEIGRLFAGSSFAPFLKIGNTLAIFS